MVPPGPPPEVRNLGAAQLLARVAREALARQLAPADDWVARVGALKLPEGEARLLRIAIIRVRCWGRSARRA